MRANSPHDGVWLINMSEAQFAKEAETSSVTQLYTGDLCNPNLEQPKPRESALFLPNPGANLGKGLETLGKTRGKGTEISPHLGPRTGHHF